MTVVLNAGFTSPSFGCRSHPVISLKSRPLLSSRRKSVVFCSETNDNSIKTTSIDSPPSSDSTAESANSNGSAKRAPLTARERLRAARVLSRYTEATPKPEKPKIGSNLLDVLKESDKKTNRKPGLPEAPTNLLDDSKRGMPKKGLTFDFPGGADILVIAFSFVFISSVMFATTFVVWKLGAIHFNEN